MKNITNIKLFIPNFTKLLLAFILFIILLLIVMILLLIDLMSVNDVVYPSISYSSSSCSCSLGTYYFDYNIYIRKSSIFDPIINLFYNNNYFPSYFIENVKLEYNCNLSVLDTISYAKYNVLCKNCNDYNLLLIDLAKIVGEYNENYS